MGLTIYYALRTQNQCPQQVRNLVSRLRQRALNLPFARVGELVELAGKDCDGRTHDRNDAGRWLLIDARESVEQPTSASGHGYHYDVLPTHLIAFATMPGDGCESSNFGLCRYPATICVPDPHRSARKKRIATGICGWQWGSFCKTQYASNPECGGVENFLRCHLVVVRLLDYAKQLGILGDVSDEGGFWDQRDIHALGRAVSDSDEMIAAAVGKLNAQFGDELVATIAALPTFEDLKAAGQKGAPDV